MIRATELAGRAVIDIDAAERLGTIDKLILDPDGRRVAGFVVVRGSGFPGNKEHITIPATAIRAIGPDAITVHQMAVAGSDIGRLETLPRGSDLIGRKVVSEDGRFLGKVSDVLIDRESGRIEVARIVGSVDRGENSIHRARSDRVPAFDELERRMLCRAGRSSARQSCPTEPDTALRQRAGEIADGDRYFRPAHLLEQVRQGRCFQQPASCAGNGVRCLDKLLEAHFSCYAEIHYGRATSNHR